MKTTRQEKRSVVRALFSRALHTYFLLTRGLTLGVRAVVRSEDGKFLLVRHTYTPGWHFPGGGVEKNESAESALVKELKQETGLSLADKPVLHGVFYNSGVSKRDHVLVFLCTVKKEKFSKKNSAEIAEIGFFDPEELPSETDSGTIRRIDEITENVAVTQSW